MLRWRALAVFGLVVSHAHGSAAGELVWRAPTTCDLEARAREQVAELVGSSLEATQGVNFETLIEELPDGSWRLTLTTTDGASQQRNRVLTGKSCAEVVDAGAVAMALAMQATVPTQRPVTESTPAAESSPSATDGVPAVAPRRAVDWGTEKRDAPGSSFRVGGGLAFEHGALPGLAPGLELNASLRLAALRVTVLGAGFAPKRSSGRPGGEFSLILGGVLGCLEGGDRWTLLGCAGYELGRLEGEGTGVDCSRLGGHLWQAAKVEAGGSFRASRRLGFELRLAAAVPMTRPEFVVNEDQRVHRAARFSARGFLGLELLL